MELAPTTELEAVNELLKAVGETPVNSLDNLGFTDASIARDTLRSKAREVQSRGWYFNRDDSFTFTPATDGTVKIPANVLSLRPCGAESRRVVPRNGFVWDMTNGTNQFDTDDGPTMEVVWFYDFQNLPETARRYITVRAATQFQTQVMGNEQVYQFTQDDEKFALNALVIEERLYEPRANMFNDSPEVSEIWTR
jgi:Autographiviridae tail tubular protein Gp11